MASPIQLLSYLLSYLEFNLKSSYGEGGDGESGGSECGDGKSGVGDSGGSGRCGCVLATVMRV